MVDGGLHRQSLRRWSRAARAAEITDLGRLRGERAQARALKSQIDALLHVADGRLALPRIGSTAFQRPPGTDWSWRPQVWRGPLPVKGIATVQNRQQLGTEMTVFHDCQISELSLRQLRNTRKEDLAPFGLRMDVFRFDGSFLSLVLDLPSEAARGLQRRHLIRVGAVVELEKPLEIFARLNVTHGPNTEQIVREFPIGSDDVSVEFDLAYTDLNEKRVDRIWVDLIFEGPEMNEVTLRDLTFSRRPRAGI